MPRGIIIEKKKNLTPKKKKIFGIISAFAVFDLYPFLYVHALVVRMISDI